MDRYQFGNLEVNFSNHTARASEDEVQFTALEFDILRYFIQHRGRTVSRKQLLRDVWGIRSAGGDQRDELRQQLGILGASTRASGASDGSGQR